MPKAVRIPLTVAAGLHAAGDVVGGGPLEIPLPGGGDGPHSGWISGAVVLDEGAEDVDYRLHLFNAQPTTIADDAAFDPTDAEILDNYLGSVLIDTSLAFNDNGAVQDSGVLVPFESNSDVLYGFLVNVDALTPDAVDAMALLVYVTMDP